VNFQAQAGDKAKEMSVDVTLKKESSEEIDGAVMMTVNQESSEETNFATTTSTSSVSSVVVDGLEFAATAGEARKRMSKKKDKDVRSTSMSMKAKYDIFEKM